MEAGRFLPGQLGPAGRASFLTRQEDYIIPIVVTRKDGARRSKPCGPSSSQKPPPRTRTHLPQVGIKTVPGTQSIACPIGLRDARKSEAMGSEPCHNQGQLGVCTRRTYLCDWLAQSDSAFTSCTSVCNKSKLSQRPCCTAIHTHPTKGLPTHQRISPLQDASKSSCSLWSYVAGE